MPGVGRWRAPRALSVRWKAELGDHVIRLAWSPDGTRLAAAEVSGPVTLFDIATGTAQVRLAGHDFGTTDLAWHPTADLIATAGQDGHARLWDTKTGELRGACPAGAAWVEHVAWAPAADRLAVAAGRKLTLWDGAGRRVRSYPDAKSTIADLAWSRDGRTFTTAAYGGLTQWSADADEPCHHFEHEGSCLAIAWSPDEKFVAAGNQDATIHFWRRPDGDDAQMFGYLGKVRELSWDRTSRFLATGGAPVVTVWDFAGAGPEDTTPLSLEAHEETLTQVAFSPLGPLLATAAGDGQIFLWLVDPARDKPILSHALTSGVSQLAWTPDGRTLAVGGDEGEVVVLAVS